MVAVGQGFADGADLGRVALLPALVNAHTHLELSYFRQQVPAGRSFVEWVRALRARRDQERAARALDQVERTARSTDNLLPVILEAVESYATVGEISDRLRAAFGEYRETVFL